MQVFAQWWLVVITSIRLVVTVAKQSDRDQKMRITGGIGALIGTFVAFAALYFAGGLSTILGGP